MEHANSAKKIGFIASQEYPILNKHLVPGFIDGARLVDPEITLDFRVIGNWYDANKAADLCASMIDSGVDVFAVIAGGAAQGLIKTAERMGAYVVFHNTNEYAAAPGVIVGCGLMEQKKLTKELLADELAGKIQYGASRTVGISDGYIRFIADDPGYRDFIPEDIQNKFNAFLKDLAEGRADFKTPPL
jgi:simple sugar transport system substrate-binding protein